MNLTKTMKNTVAALLGLGVLGSTALAQTPRTWDDGIVYFDWDSALTSAERTKFKKGMDVWSQSSADVVFLPRNGLTGVPYVFITNGGNSYTSAGAPTAGNSYTLQVKESFGTWFHAHEIGHALGFLHEHQRDDRDTYVRVVNANITAGQEVQYEIQSSSRWLYDMNTYGFDFDSVMMYPYCFNTTCNTPPIDCPTVFCSPDKGQSMVPRAAFEGSVAGFENWNESLETVDINRARAVYGTGHVRYVDGDAGDGSTGGFNKPYTGINGAQNNTPAGGRVFVDGDTYTPGAFIFNKDLVWRAHPNDTVVIR